MGLFFEFEQLFILTKVSINVYDREGNLVWRSGDLHERIAGRKDDFLAALIQKAEKLSGPVIEIEMDDILLACMRVRELFVMVGPVSVNGVDYTRRHLLYKLYQVKSSEEFNVPRMRFFSFVQLMILIFHMGNKVALSYDEIITLNDLEQVKFSEMEQEKTIQRQRKQDEDGYHHTFMEEKKWLDSIRAGDVDHAGDYAEVLSASAGTLSLKALNHTRNLAIVAVTLGTRVAIDSGVSPAEAYEASDILIKKIDSSSRVTELNLALKEISQVFAQMVQKQQKNKVYANYVEQCKWYIEENYQRKVCLEEMAEYLGINKSYLSHVFSKNVGMKMKDYLNQIRVERAQNLLRYSESTLVEISDYVGFCSQSYFGQIFKKYAGMTPQQYRNYYRNKEFVNKSQSSKRK